MLATQNRLRVIKRKSAEMVDFDNVEIKEKRYTRRERYSLTDELSNDQFYFVNFLVLKLKEKFPDDRRMWYVGKKYPHTIEGEIYFDEPVTTEDIDLCILKSAFMKSIDLLYVVITPNMTLQEAHFELNRVKR